ncbi:hypothetical protein [Lysinibacillus sp. LZ02]|uniref:hypothetical protein n=1 Tax=Lysinibacillus sp. LZ02 TaxID=3420668 RepID=UPI003D35C784
MRFYPPDNRRRPISPMYRQRFGPPTQMRRPGNPFFVPNQMRGQEQFFYSPYQQPQFSQFGRLPEHLNAIMGHAGTITNGVNMLRQMGALLSMFR